MSCFSKPRHIREPAGVKQTISSQVFPIFELGSITKYLMTGPAGNSEFCFPSTSMLRVSGKQNSLFPLWPVFKCLLNTFSWHTMEYPNCYLGLLGIQTRLKACVYTEQTQVSRGIFLGVHHSEVLHNHIAGIYYFSCTYRMVIFS